MSDLNNVPTFDISGKAPEKEESSLENALEERQGEEPEKSEELKAQAEGEELETEESKDKDPFDAKFAALSRREKAFREEVEQKNKALDEKLAMIQEKLSAFEEVNKEPEPEPEIPFEQRLKRDPLQALRDAGYDYDTLTNIALNDGKLTPEMEMKLMKEELESGYKSEIQKLREQLEEQKEKESQLAKEKEEQEYSKTVENFKSEIRSFVDSSESHDLIKEYKAHDQIFEVISSHHAETGKVMDVEEAANYVEEYLLEEARKLVKNERIRKRVLPEDQEPQKKPSGVTLSNSQSSQIPVETRPVSNEESIARAAAKLRWLE